ncbi:cysteine hydrolase family protein [Salidesulfovibrio brasiliensis]|uniref:cysteine hydrolase n=1 Tax=Salidesulfovibrio brasiliensis TaxID=221711 RepID=UPI0006D24160|nr:cysteine hydrolase [Salidesulfovibrio brasiliensis]
MLHDVKKDQSALVFIEFQNEWLAEDGVLQTLLIKDKKPFRDAVRNAASVLETAREHGFPVAHAGLNLSADPGYRLFNGGQNVLGLRKAIPKAKTWQEQGSRFVEPFVPRNGEYVVSGRSGASVLKNSTLDPFLRNNGINTLFFMGFATHVCVESSMREAHDLGYNAYLVEDACAAFEESQHEHVLKHVVHHFGASITSDSLTSFIKDS